MTAPRDWDGETSGWFVDVRQESGTIVSVAIWRPISDGFECVQEDGKIYFMYGMTPHCAIFRQSEIGALIRTKVPYRIPDDMADG